MQQVDTLMSTVRAAEPDTGLQVLTGFHLALEATVVAVDPGTRITVHGRKAALADLRRVQVVRGAYSERPAGPDDRDRVGRRGGGRQMRAAARVLLALLSRSPRSAGSLWRRPTPSCASWRGRRRRSSPARDAFRGLPDGDRAALLELPGSL